jgi:hypothetical protein
MAPKNLKKAVEAAPPASDEDVNMVDQPSSVDVNVDQNSPQALANNQQRIRVVSLKYTYHGRSAKHSNTRYLSFQEARRQLQVLNLRTRIIH